MQKQDLKKIFFFSTQKQDTRYAQTQVEKLHRPRDKRNEQKKVTWVVVNKVQSSA